jgi:hypothetical protein
MTSRGLRLSGILALALATSAPALARSGALPPVLARDAGADGLVRIDRAALAQRLARGATVAIDGIPLPGGARADLDLERFRITTPATRLVVAGAGGERAIDFDPESVVLLRGAVRDVPGSRAYLAVSPFGTLGVIDAAPGRFAIGPAAGAADPDHVVIEAVQRGGFLPPGVPPCLAIEEAGAHGAGAAAQSGVGGGSPAPPVVRVIELAIETDYEYSSLFGGNLFAAGAYAVQLYGAVAAIYQRDVGATFDITFLRLWDTPEDLFNSPNPLADFRTFWTQYMKGIPRDLAQFLSGRRDLGFGGVAYLAGVCEDFHYCVVAYINGSMPDDLGPSVFHYDASVVAHEIGHVCGSLHSHQYGIDSCNDFDAPPRRGTLMSYCGQTVSGGHANIDLRFHVAEQDVMREFLATCTCLHTDCNGNGVPDEVDVARMTSPDVNGNGLPDECEDCNGNGVLDSIDIASRTSDDVDVNGLPDECQADCNGNDVPDAHDIAEGTSIDANGDRVPDECEADVDRDGRPDYGQIQHDMTLDVDRNAALDAYEDCDGDGTTDLAALGGAHAVWAASRTQGELRLFHSLTGVAMDVSRGGRVAAANDLVVAGPDRVLVSSGLDDRVVEYDRAGAFVRDLVAAGAGGLDEPAAMAIAPGGSIVVASRGTHAVIEYDGATGAPVRTLVARQAGGLQHPFGLAYGPRGNLFVTSATNEVLEFSGATGAFVGTLVKSKDNGGLDDPRGIAWVDGRLLVASMGTNQILEYDAAGHFVQQFNKGGTEAALTLDEPWCIRVGPEGDVYVSRHDVTAPAEGEFLRDPELHLNASRIYIFDRAAGIFRRSFVLGNDTGYWSPTGFDFLPDDGGIDCNHNARQDSCDIAAGRSDDLNDNGIPDECDGYCLWDLDGDGGVDFGDLLRVLAAWGRCAECPEDLDDDGAVGFSDLLAVLAAWHRC